MARTQSCGLPVALFTSHSSGNSSAANLAKRSQCSTTMVLSTNLYFVRSYVGSGAG